MGTWGTYKGHKKGAEGYARDVEGCRSLHDNSTYLPTKYQLASETPSLLDISYL